MKTITIPRQVIPKKTIQLYRFEELPEASQEKLLEEHKEKIYSYGYAWEDELYHSLETACKIFGIQYSEDTYGNMWPSYKQASSMDYIDKSEATNMAFKRAIAYINNRFNFKTSPYIYKYNGTITNWQKLTKIKIRFDQKRKEETEKLKNWKERAQYYNEHPYPNILRTYNTENQSTKCTEYIFPIEIATKKKEDNLPTGYCEDYVIHETYKQFIEEAKNIKRKDKRYVLNHFYTLNDFFSLLIGNFKKARDKEREYQESIEHLENDVYINENDWFLEDGTKWENRKEEQ